MPRENLRFLFFCAALLRAVDASPADLSLDAELEQMLGALARGEDTRDVQLTGKGFEVNGPLANDVFAEAIDEVSDFGERVDAGRRALRRRRARGRRRQLPPPPRGDDAAAGLTDRGLGVVVEERVDQADRDGLGAIVRAPSLRRTSARCDFTVSSPTPICSAICLRSRPWREQPQRRELLRREVLEVAEVGARGERR